MQGPEFNARSHFEIDECGKVHTISTSVAMLIPLYYLPLILLALVTITMIIVKISNRWFKNRLVNLTIHTHL